MISTTACGNQALFDAIGAAETNPIGTKFLAELFVTAENGFSSGEKIAEEESVSLT